MATQTYNGPAAIVSRVGEISVWVNLGSRADPDGGTTWAGHLDVCDRGELRRTVQGLLTYGLVLRFPDGSEGNFMPSPEVTWSSLSITITGFMRCEPAQVSVRTCAASGINMYRNCRY